MSEEQYVDGALEGDVILDFTGLFPPRIETVEDTSTQDILEDIQNQITQLQTPDDSFAFGDERLDTHSETQVAIQEEFSEAWSTIEEDKTRIQAAQDKADQADVNAGLALEAASEAIVSSEIQYVLSISDTTPPGPEAAWSPTSPERTPGAYIWMRTKVTRGNDEITYSAPALITGNDGATGEASKTISLVATTQILTSPASGGATSPTTATVTGTASNTTISAWQYSVDGASFSDTVPTGVSRTGNVVTITGSTMTSKTIAVRMSDASGVADTLTVAKVLNGTAGTPGADAYTVLLSNEAHVFAGGTTSAIAATTTSTVIAYKGSTQQSATVGTITGHVTGLTTSIASNGTTAPVITLTATTSLTTKSGTLTVPVTVDGTTFTKTIAWSLSLTGGTGSQGVSVTSIVSYFAALPQGSSAPATPGNVATPPAPWVATEPTYAPATELWRTERIAYSNSTYSYTTPQKSSAWAAAVYIGNLNDAAIKGLVRVSSTDPGFFEGRIWWEIYPAGDPKAGQVKAIKYSASASGPWVPYMLAANDVLVPGSVKAGTIDTDDLAAEVAFVQKFIANQAFMKEVYANKVLVASDNILPDPAISNPLFWASSPYFSATGGKSGTGSLQIPQNSVQSGLYNSAPANVSTYGIRVEEGKSYVFSAWAKSLDAAHDSANKIAIYVRGHNEAGTQTVAPTIIAQSPGAAIDTWVKLEGVYGPVPSGTTRIAVGYYKQASLTNSRVWFSDPIVKERVGAISLEDGVVTAVKVDTGSLVAGNVLVAGGNLIRDTSFTYWRPWGGSVSQWSVQPTGGPNSTPALAIAAGAANYGGQLGSDNFTQFRVDAQPNSRYSLSAWVHCTTAIPVGGVSLGIGRINFSGVKSDTSASNTVIIPANTWTKLTVYVNTLADTVQIGFYLASREVNSTGITKFSAPYCSAPASLVVDGEITGTTITGGLVQTNSSAERGVKIVDDSIRIWNAAGTEEIATLNSAGELYLQKLNIQEGHIKYDPSYGELEIKAAFSQSRIYIDNASAGFVHSVDGRKAGLDFTAADEYLVYASIGARSLLGNARFRAFADSYAGVRGEISIGTDTYLRVEPYEVTASLSRGRTVLKLSDGTSGLLEFIGGAPTYRIIGGTEPAVEYVRNDTSAGIYTYATSSTDGELGIRLRPIWNSGTSQTFWYLSKNGRMRSVVDGVTRDHPFAMYPDIRSVTPAAANTTYSYKITFPNGLFTKTPAISVSASTSLPERVVVSYGSASSTSVTIYYRRTDTTAFPISVIAFQATP